MSVPVPPLTSSLPSPLLLPVATNVSSSPPPDSPSAPSAAVDHVVAAVAAEQVAALVAPQRVVPCTAAHRVPARAADELVVGGAAVQLVGGSAAEDGLGGRRDVVALLRGAARDRVLAVVGDVVDRHQDARAALAVVGDVVRTALAVERVGPAGRDVLEEDVAVVAAELEVVALPAGDRVVAGPALQAVGARVAEHAVVRGATAEVLDVGVDVVARAVRPVVGRAVQGAAADRQHLVLDAVGVAGDVGVGAAEQLVRVGRPSQGVVAVAAAQDVLPDAAHQRVVAVEALDRVGAGTARQRVVRRPAAQVLHVGLDVVARARRPVVGRAVVGRAVDVDGLVRRAGGVAGEVGRAGTAVVCVGAGVAAHPVVAVAPVQDVVAEAAVEAVGAAEPLEGVGHAGARDHVRRRAAADVLDVGAHVVPRAGRAVVGRAVVGDVVDGDDLALRARRVAREVGDARAAVVDVGAHVPAHPVVAGAAVEDVVAEAADERVVPAAGRQRVVAEAAVERVGRAAADRGRVVAVGQRQRDLRHPRRRTGRRVARHRAPAGAVAVGDRRHAGVRDRVAAAAERHGDRVDLGYRRGVAQGRAVLPGGRRLGGGGDGEDARRREHQAQPDPHGATLSGGGAMCNTSIAPWSSGTAPELGAADASRNRRGREQLHARGGGVGVGAARPADALAAAVCLVGLERQEGAGFALGGLD